MTASMLSKGRSYDVAVVGAGPVGSVAALAHAREGAQVLLLEANPQASMRRLAGEWLHPPAVMMLRDLGVEVRGLNGTYPTGEGFVVYPDDGEAPSVLPYGKNPGYGVEHSDLVGAIRGAASAHANVSYVPKARVTEIKGQHLTYNLKGSGTVSVLADRIVGADGRTSVVRQSLGLPVDHITCSRMVGLLLRDVEMPFEGYGHVFLGGPGPILAYRIAPGDVRMIMDVPLEAYQARQGRTAYLWEAYGPAIPEEIRPHFKRALTEGPILWATNQVRSRNAYGRPGTVLVGDAVGHHHPLTALGMTLGFQDAVTLATTKSFHSYRLKRQRRSRMSEMLAVGLYEVLADNTDETVAMRQAIYRMWRANPRERYRTMSFLACENDKVTDFAGSFLKACGLAITNLGSQYVRNGYWEQGREICRSFGSRALWLTAGALHLRAPSSVAFLRGKADAGKKSIDHPDFHGALGASMPRAQVLDMPPSRTDKPAKARAALERAADSLISYQRDEGSWEGEVVWNALLAAQYVLMTKVVGQPISNERRESLLKQFRATRLDDGSWGMHPKSPPYLFVTSLVYVAARLLDVSADDELITRAGRFIRSEGGVEAIPSWGKFWLAMLGLYEWSGVNPILPELWKLPRWMPLHPSNYYSHTRLTYMAMAAIYGVRLRAPLDERLSELREELYPQGYDNVDFATARDRLRAQELKTPPSGPLRFLYRVAQAVDNRRGTTTRRAEVLGQLHDRIRWELDSTEHTSISPVSGLLNIIALWSADPADPDVSRAVERLEKWMWEDEEKGLRVAGARSASWDTGFALQSLATSMPYVDATDTLRAGAEYLKLQQIREAPEGYEQAFRVDPTGGWCFAGAWHGWPVSDCTAEAVTALTKVSETLKDPSIADTKTLRLAADFMLSCQNGDGGFGSYEARRSRVGLEWLNPAEMFSDSMTEQSFVECTASCVEALAAIRGHVPYYKAATIDRAISRAVSFLRVQQRPDGSWPAAWGVYYTYGTMFGVRGLIASGTPVTDPHVRKACRWLLEAQQPDGGWGEHHESCVANAYTQQGQSQVIQTAWALSTLLMAKDPSWKALERGVNYLLAIQDRHGEWPEQDMAGVFFNTALLDYELYRRYFPLWALSLYETRRRERSSVADAAPKKRSKAAAAS